MKYCHYNIVFILHALGFLRTIALRFESRHTTAGSGANQAFCTWGGEHNDTGIMYRWLFDNTQCPSWKLNYELFVPGGVVAKANSLDRTHGDTTLTERSVCAEFGLFSRIDKYDKANFWINKHLTNCNASRRRCKRPVNKASCSLLFLMWWM